MTLKVQFPGIQLVQEAFPWLSAFLVKYASRKVKRRLAELGAHLCAFAEETLHMSDANKRALERDGRIGRLLQQIEDFVSAPDPNNATLDATASHPTLRAIAALQSIVDEQKEATVQGPLSLGSWLWAGTSQSSTLTTSIKKAVSRKSINYDLIVQTLQDCSDITADDDLDDESEVDLPATDDVQNYTKRAREMRKVLVKHASCSCSHAYDTRTEGGSSRHWARLRLKPVYAADHQHHLPFDMLFSVSPDPRSTQQYDWQEVQFLMSLKAARSRGRVHFAGDAPLLEPNAQDTGALTSETVANLCTFIGSNCGSVLCFKLSQERLQVLHDPAVPDRPSNGLSSTCGMRLSDIVQRFDMRYGMRPVLAYTLAKAVWLHYDSEWMSVGISDDTVYFMGEDDDDEGTSYFCKPYMSTNVEADAYQDTECRQVIGLLHRYPRVIALGIMLVEIATGQHMHFEGQPNDWSPRTANEKLTVLRKFLSNGSFQEDCRFPRYKAAVEKCLDPMLFKNSPFNASRPQENLEERKRILYDEVVSPLRKLIEGTGWDSEFDELERTALVPKNVNEFRSSKGHLGNAAAKTPLEDLQPASHTRTKRNAWIEQVAQINYTLKKQSRRNLNGRRVRVAILDTGYDTDVPTFDLPGRAKCIKKWRDFVARSPDPVDNDGHGTHLLTLLLQLECPADIYVARITENSQQLGQAQENIAEAIQIAAHEWDVDLVSMSFGFPHHIQAITDAIFEAKRHKNGAITFFAAANNDGLNSREMFPANLGDPVLSIRGTDQSGAFDPRFNPPLSSAEPVFGTLGVDVVSDWIGQTTTRPMSGCSVATPVSVTIAAMLLTYTMSHPDDFTQKDIDGALRSRRGIFEMFKESSYAICDQAKVFIERKILLGNLIADPSTPHRALANLGESDWPAVTEIIHKDAVFTKNGDQGASVSLGASLLEAVGAKVEGTVGRTHATELGMEALRTEAFSRDPEEESIRNLITSSPRARRVLVEAPVWRPGKLYLITGLKIAQGFSVTSSSSRSHGGKLGGDAPVLAAAGLSVGSEVGGNVEKGEGSSMKVEGDVILAYRLLKISLKGLRRKELSMDEVRGKASERMLGHSTDDGREPGVEDLELGEISDGDLDDDDDNGDMEALRLFSGNDIEEGSLQFIDPAA